LEVKWKSYKRNKQTRKRTRENKKGRKGRRATFRPEPENSPRPTYSPAPKRYVSPLSPLPTGWPHLSGCLQPPARAPRRYSFTPSHTIASPALNHNPLSKLRSSIKSPQPPLSPLSFSPSDTPLCR
jgi:hypothetical protein